MKKSVLSPSLPELPDLLTREEVRQVLRICESTLYRGLKAGRFPAPVSVGPRSMRWHKADIDAYLRGTWFPETEQEEA